MARLKTETYLFIDDDLFFRETLQAALAAKYPEHKIKFMEFGSGEELIDADLDYTRYTFAIVDLILPGMDGIDIAMHIRKKNATLPIVLVTGNSQNERCNVNNRPPELSSNFDIIQKTRIPGVLNQIESKKKALMQSGSMAEMISKNFNQNRERAIGFIMHAKNLKGDGHEAKKLLVSYCNRNNLKLDDVAHRLLEREISVEDIE
jgi:CheY-like chemotaxis protein